MVLLTKFCCCCDLRRGTLVWGWHGLIGSILNLVIFIFTWETFLRTLSELIDPLTYKYVMPAIMAASVIFPIVTVVSNVVLLWGMYKNKSSFVLGSLIIFGIGIVKMTLFILIVGGYMISLDKERLIGIIIYIVGILAIGTMTYSWLCVVSFYQTLREEKNTPTSNILEEVGSSTILVEDRIFYSKHL